MLDSIATSPNVTIADLDTFNIKKKVLLKKTRTTATTPLTNQVAVAIDERANCVQYAFQVDEAAPVSANAPNLRHKISIRASLVLALGSASSDQKLYIYFRWYNTKHPKLAGYWSALINALTL